MKKKKKKIIITIHLDSYRFDCNMLHTCYLYRDELSCVIIQMYVNACNLVSFIQFINVNLFHSFSWSLRIVYFIVCLLQQCILSECNKSLSLSISLTGVNSGSGRDLSNNMFIGKFDIVPVDEVQITELTLIPKNILGKFVTRMHKN